jgi:hypothetical protein
MADEDVVVTFRTTTADAEFLRGLALGKGTTKSGLLRDFLRKLRQQGGRPEDRSDE